MNKRCVLGFIILVIALTLSACQKTPETPVITNKKDSKLDDAILSSDTPNETLKPEANCQEQLISADNSVTININAAVETPEITKISVVSCIPHYFTIEEVKKAIDLFYGDENLYDNSLSDQGWLESEIISRKADLDYLKKNGEYPKIEGDDGERIVTNLEEEIIWLENMIAELEADYGAVSDGSSGIEKIELKENDTGSESVNVRDGNIPPMEFYAFNYKEVNDAAMEYGVTGYNISTGTPLGLTDQLDIDITREEAESKALEVASGCGITECKVVSVGKTVVEEKNSYVFTLGRLIGGVPSIPIPNYEGTQSFGTDGKEYREPWRQENIQVVVNETGVIGFLWEYPPEILKVLNENVAILTYEEIKEIAKNQFQRSQSANEFELSQSDGKTIEINKIVLNMMHIAEKDSLDSYYYLPVWDFLGRTVNTGAETSEDVVPAASEKSFLTINAIDGSIVDRGLGY